MITIVPEIIQHKGKQVLLLRFPYDQPLINLIKHVPGAQWSRTQKAWYFLYTEDILKEVKQLFKEIAIIDCTTTTLNQKENLPGKVLRIKDYRLSEESKTLLNKYKSWLRSRRYSENTIDTYIDALTTFLKFNSAKPVSEITNEDVIDFNNNYILANNYSASFQNQVVNAIKLFFKTVQHTNINAELIHRPKRAKQLPNVLSKEEVKQILDAPRFLKHKAMLSLVYSCGLRCGELLRLKPEHIDSKRNLLIIKQSKGRKDRIAPLSDKTIQLLRDYYKAFKPIVYLFEGENTGTPYTQRSLQNVLKQCILKAGINKPVTLHWLRHSYATHLLEGGTDLRYIQEILGHSSSRTTEIYTHVSTKSIQKIISPFDSL